MKDSRKIDLDILDDLIGQCEDSMVHPFKKKKAVAIAIEPEEKEESEDHEEKPDLSEMDMEELLQLYSEMKDKE